MSAAHATIDLERKLVLATRLGDQRRNATHAIAAGARLGAVVVVNADQRIGARRARRIERHELVVGRASGLRRGAGVGGADRDRRLAHIDHNDLVAETVHLDERPVGERAHEWTG